MRIFKIVLVTLALGPLAHSEVKGLIVESIAADSVAAKAGIKVGDWLISYDGKSLTSPAMLQALQQNTIGKTEVGLKLRRGNEVVELMVPVGALAITVRPDLPPAALKLYSQANFGRDLAAVTLLTAAAQAAQEAGDKLAAAWLHGRVGSINELQRKWKEALAAHAQAWELMKSSLPSLQGQGAGSEVDAATQSQTLAALGRCSRNLNDFSAALQWYEQARQVNGAADFEISAAFDLNNLGIVAGNRGDLSAAHEHFSRALTILDRLVPNSLTVAGNLSNLGVIANDRGDLIAALDYQTRALMIKERLAPNSLTVATTLNNLGDVARNRGDLNTAHDYQTRALMIKERLAPNSLDLATTLGNLGVIANDRGDLSAALDYYARALTIHDRLAPNSLTVANLLNNLGVVARNRGDLNTAHDYQTRALTIRERLAPASLIVAASLGNLGYVAHGRGDLSAAHDYHSRALAISERLAPNSLTVAANLTNLGAVAYVRGDLSAAYDYHSRALTIRERLAPDSLNVATSLSNLGTVAKDRSDLSAAHNYYTRALTIRERLAPDSLNVAISLDNLGNLALMESRFPAALESFTRAIAILESQRRAVQSTEARSLLIAQHGGKYSRLLRAQIALKDLPAALATLERSRARSLTELIRERALDLRVDAPAELLAQQQELDRDRAIGYATLARLDPNKDEDQRGALRQTIELCGVRQRQLDTEIRKGSPRFATLQYPQPLDLRGVQAALDAGTLLLTYMVDDDETHLFAVTRRELHHFALEVKGAELRDQVKAFREALAARAVARGRDRKLYDLLVRPAQPLVDKAERVLICPDGPLHQLPFAALIADAKGTYFGERKPLHTIVSMTVYAETRKSQVSNQKSKMTVLAFGDPVYAAKDAPADARGLKLEPLPGTRAEVEAVAKLFGNAATVRLGKDASESNARRELVQANYVHVACHGVLDPHDALGSGLALSADDQNNGLLQAWEIIEKVKLNADLVVLSACQTGLGETTKHEGVVGLTRALQYAGAKSIVVSLWSVSDDSTAALMTAFYTELKRGTSKDVALQRAMAAVRKNPKWSHPFYWAPFTLVGDWR